MIFSQVKEYDIFTTQFGYTLISRQPPGYQEVAGLTPARSATFFRGDLIMKYFLWSFSPFGGFKKTLVSFWRDNVHNTS